ncbi:PAS domain S-box protein [bacterium]|nr:PAS domain S-box protein [bacterium]
MKNKYKTKQQLQKELEETKKRVAELEKSESDWKQAEEALKKSEEWYRSIVESSHAGIMVVDENFRFTYVNDEFIRILGYYRKEIIGEDFRGFLDKESQELVQDRYIRRQKGEKVPPRYEFSIIRKDGEKRQVEISSTVLKTLKGENRTIAQILDITELKKTIKKLRESEQRFRSVVENANDAIYIINPQGLQYVNPAFEEINGYSSEEIYSEDFNFWDLIHPEDVQMVKEREKAQKRGEKIPSRYELRIISKDGKIKIVELATVNIGEKGEAQVMGILRDVTERKRAEEKIKKSLKEKEVLLKEVHHRVKNNMQVISSLLNLQASRIEDKKALESFKATQRRVHSMALVHDRLYKSEDFATLDFNQYIEQISTHLLRFYRDKMEKVKIQKDIKNVFIDINKAVPLGLIINELVSNSLKHAFPDDKKGEIKIKFHKKDSQYELEISDNGIGFPEDLDFRKTPSMGMHLVSSLVDQINGEIKLDRKPHPSFQITFQE